MDAGALDIAFRLLAVMALVFANGFFVAAEFSLVTVRKTRIDQLVSEGNRWARTVRRALTDPDAYIAATQLGITMASLGLGWIGEPALANLIEPVFQFLPAPVAVTTAHTISAAIAFAIITALHIVLGELAPKTVALANPESVSLWVAKPTELFMRGFWPFIALLNGMGRAVVTTFGFKPPSGHALVHSEEELKMLVTASQEAGVLEEQEEQMLHRVFGFGDLVARQVMVPRTEMVAVPETSSVREAAVRLAESPHARVSVFRNSLDDILGVVDLRDLLRPLADGRDTTPLSQFVRDAITVPETLSADDLLALMQRQGTREAVVIDEYGGTAGFVTFEGLMERIVGDLGHSGEAKSARTTILADGSALLDGLTLVGDVNERFGLHIDEKEYNTLGGYVLGRLGRRPRIGDRVEVEGRVLRVEALDGLRVSRVYLAKPSQHAGPPSI